MLRGNKVADISYRAEVMVEYFMHMRHVIWWTESKQRLIELLLYSSELKRQQI